MNFLCYIRIKSQHRKTKHKRYIAFIRAEHSIGPPFLVGRHSVNATKKRKTINRTSRDRHPFTFTVSCGHAGCRDISARCAFTYICDWVPAVSWDGLYWLRGSVHTQTHTHRLSVLSKYWQLTVFVSLHSTLPGLTEQYIIDSFNCLHATITVTVILLVINWKH